MRNINSTFIAMTISTAILLILPGQAGAVDRLGSLDFELNAGSRVDQFDWNIAGDTSGANPNILSELTWDDLEIFEINGKAQVVMYNNKLPFGGTVKVSLNYGDIRAGDVQDSDYDSDNRTDEFSRSNNKADIGEVWDLTVGAGLVFKTKDRKFTFSPLIGFSQHNQDLTLHDGVQTIADPSFTSVSLGTIDDLDSHYDAEWRSGWAGFDLDYQVTPLFAFHGSVELHVAEYEATANWNLRDDLAHPESFSHNADTAYGFVSNFGTTVGRGNVQINLDLNYQSWQAEDGLATVYFSDGTFAETRLNEVNWESFSVSTGLTVKF